ncbi:Ig-like domain-containing protein [Kitasatospora sp. NPDC057965]|uniref:Ig-like domain-containing protein n=1 Tax=Kitasatospora sp. NPDC057965 TaxID=3346291 RepID=UPI0036D76E9E
MNRQFPAAAGAAVLATGLVIGWNPPPSAARQVEPDRPSAGLHQGGATALTLSESTNDPGIRLTGTGEPGGTVVVTDRSPGGQEDDLCYTTVGADGGWSCLPVENLADGRHRLTPSAADLAGNRTAGRPADLVVDTAPPDRPLLTAPAAGETVRVARPRLSGKAEPGARVLVTAGPDSGDGPARIVACGATAAVDGSWTCTANRDLTDGERWLIVTATDPAGNSTAAEAVVVRVEAIGRPAATTQVPLPPFPTRTPTPTPTRTPSSAPTPSPAPSPSASKAAAPSPVATPSQDAPSAPRPSAAAPSPTVTAPPSPTPSVPVPARPSPAASAPTPTPAGRPSPVLPAAPVPTVAVPAPAPASPASAAVPATVPAPVPSGLLPFVVPPAIGSPAGAAAPTPTPTPTPAPTAPGPAPAPALSVPSPTSQAPTPRAPAPSSASAVPSVASVPSLASAAPDRERAERAPAAPPPGGARPTVRAAGAANSAAVAETAAEEPSSPTAADRHPSDGWRGVLAAVLLVLTGIGLITRRVIGRGSGPGRH